MADENIIPKKLGNVPRNLATEFDQTGLERRTKKSMDWFRKKATRMRRINRTELFNQEQILLKNRTIMGSMFMWAYDPKHKKTLPYYDSFPLGIIVDRVPGGFRALNLHYLPPLLRGQFLLNLSYLTNNKKYDDTTRYQLTYSMLKKSVSMRYFQPCFKHYLTKHVRSRFGLIPADEWEIVSFLPLADWQKASGQQVYADSRKLIK